MCEQNLDSFSDHNEPRNKCSKCLKYKECDFCICCFKLFCIHCADIRTENDVTYVVCCKLDIISHKSFLESIGLTCDRLSCIHEFKKWFYDCRELDIKFYHCSSCHTVDSYASFAKCRSCGEFVCCGTDYTDRKTNIPYHQCHVCDNDDNNDDAYFNETYNSKDSFGCFQCDKHLVFDDEGDNIFCLRTRKNQVYFFCVDCKHNIPEDQVCNYKDTKYYLYAHAWQIHTTK